MKVGRDAGGETCWMDGLESTRAGLGVCAGHLDARRGRLMEMWRDAVSDDATLDVHSDWTIKQFNDHFPDVLEAFGRALRAWPDTPPLLARDKEDYAVEHARARWLQGYSLRGVIREWGHFNRIVVDQIGACTLAGVDQEQQVRRVAQGIWADLLNGQMTRSALEYQRLEQAGAATRAAELMRTLERVQQLAAGRGRALEGIAAGMRNDLQLVMTSQAPDAGTNAWNQQYELRRIADDGMRGLEQALLDLATLAQLEAGQESRSICRFDAAEGLVLLCEGLQHNARDCGATLEWSGPDHLEVEGDPERVRRLVRRLLLHGLHAGTSALTVHWHGGEAARTWTVSIAHERGRHAPSPAGRALADASVAVKRVVGLPVEDSMQAPSADGVDLLIAKQLVELLGASLEMEVDGDLVRYRISLPVAYPRQAHASR